MLDFLFPKYCVNCKKIGSYLCDNCFSFISFDVLGLCVVCDRPSIDGLTHPGCQSRYAIDGAFSSIRYKGVVKKLLYAFKYKPYVSDLEKILVQLFYEGLIQNESFQNIYQKFQQHMFLVPIPLHGSKLKSRGYNQAELLAKGISQNVKLQSLHLLTRIKKTSTQFKLTKTERKENMRDAFEIKKESQNLVRGSSIFLVDDVLTTGSTLLEAGKMLKKNGAKKVWGITLARD